VGYGSPIQLPAQSINAIHSTGEFVFATLWLRAGKKKYRQSVVAFSQKPEWPFTLPRGILSDSAFATELTFASANKRAYSWAHPATYTFQISSLVLWRDQ
jgi:hypothetical protein